MKKTPVPKNKTNLLISLLENLNVLTLILHQFCFNNLYCKIYIYILLNFL